MGCDRIPENAIRDERKYRLGKRLNSMVIQKLASGVCSRGAPDPRSLSAAILRTGSGGVCILSSYAQGRGAFAVMVRIELIERVREFIPREWMRRTPLRQGTARGQMQAHARSCSRLCESGRDRAAWPCRGPARRESRAESPRHRNPRAARSGSASSGPRVAPPRCPRGADKPSGARSSAGFAQGSRQSSRRRPHDRSSDSAAAAACGRPGRRKAGPDRTVL